MLGSNDCKGKMVVVSKMPFEDLKFYQNICEIRKVIFDITEHFDSIHVRLVRQMRDAARSAKQNIREGYMKDSVGEFAQGIKIAKGSLHELKGDLNDCFEDGLIQKNQHDFLQDMIGKTNNQMDRYLDSLYRMEREGTWKQRFPSPAKRKSQAMKNRISSS